jgi:hypothetical protein
MIMISARAAAFRSPPSFPLAMSEVAFETSGGIAASSFYGRFLTYTNC